MIEWVVDDSCLEEEPLIFEAQTSPSKIVTVTNALDAGDNLPAVADEPNYFGDISVVEELFDPVHAFELCSTSSLSQARGFSIEADVPYGTGTFALRGVQESSKRKPDNSNAALALPLESRTERLERLRAEIDSLRNSSPQETAVCTKDRLPNLGELRKALNSLSCELSPRCKAPDGGALDQGPLASSRRALLIEEARLARIESTFQHSTAADIGGVWGLVASIRTHLETINGASMRDVRRTVEELASIVENGPELSRLADVSELLVRLEAVEMDAAGVPTLAARLRSLKGSLDDAGNTMSALSNLTMKYESLLSHHLENKALMEKVDRNLSSTTEVMNRNLAILEKQFAGVLGVDGSDKD